MKSKKIPAHLIVVVLLAVSIALASGQDSYTLKVPNGLAFSEFRGYESWQLVSISEDGGKVAAILANPVMIKAYQEGIPGNGKPFPDGAKMTKIHWNPKKMETFPAATVPGTQHDVDFMVKDSKRIADSGGRGWAAFEYDAASDTFRPGNSSDKPPQENDAKCGARVPHHREDKRLRFYGVREEVTRGTRPKTCMLSTVPTTRRPMHSARRRRKGFGESS